MTNNIKHIRIPSSKALALMTIEDQQMIERLDKSQVQKLKFKDGCPSSMPGRHEAASYLLIMETCKTSDINGALQLISNAAAAQRWDDQDTCLNVAHAQMQDLAPQTPLEAMLISQMVAVNATIGKLMYRAMLKEQTFEGRELNLKHATKLQRTFLQQIEALQKLRGKGQQTVRVEHVTVNAGGQAIVGNVEHHNGGEGNYDK